MAKPNYSKLLQDVLNGNENATGAWSDYAIVSIDAYLLRGFAPNWSVRSRTIIP